MISRPTSPQLIDAVCEALQSKVALALTDPTVRVALDMACAVLQTVGVRSAKEIAFMREEAEAIEALATRFVNELPDSAGLAEALRSYTDGKSASSYLDDVLADYDRASEVLSCAAEAAYASGDAGHIEALAALYDQRLSNENAVIGVFAAVGRTE